jgi:hypothetical protein
VNLTGELAGRQRIAFPLSSMIPKVEAGLRKKIMLHQEIERSSDPS